MSDINKVGNICDRVVHAKCVDTEHKLHKNSKITSNCYNQHEVNEDVAAELDQLFLGPFSNDCHTYQVNQPSEQSRSQQIIEQMADHLCGLKQTVETLQETISDISNLNITSWGLDTKCLVDDCGAPIETLGALIQTMINKDCE